MLSCRYNIIYESNLGLLFILAFKTEAINTKKLFNNSNILYLKNAGFFVNKM